MPFWRHIREHSLPELQQSEHTQNGMPVNARM
jgi:hypothetical protein